MTPENGRQGALVPLGVSDYLNSGESSAWTQGGETFVDFWPHPFLDEGRRWVVCRQGQSLAAAMDSELPPWQAAVASVNGAVVSREAWGDLVLSPADIVQVRAVPQRDAFRALLLVLVVVGAALLGPVVAGALGVTSVIGVSLITAGLGIIGVLLVNVLFPPRLPEAHGGAKLEQQYTLSGGSNKLRPHDVLQLVFGSHRHFPDLVSKEYVEFGDADKNDQYLNQIFDAGIGDNLELSNWRIGEAPLANYEGVDTQDTLDADGHITLVAENVDSIAGGAFSRTNLTVTRRTAVGTVRVAFDLESINYWVTNKSKIEGRTATFALEYKLTTESAWQTDSHMISSPDGSKGRSAVRRTVKTVVLAAGQYDVRCRVTAIQGHSTSTDLDDAWPEHERRTIRLGVNFKAYGVGMADFTGRNPYALRIKASGQLSGRIQELNCDANQRIPSWNGAAWIPNSVTSNPGDLLIQWYRGWKTDNDTTAGYGLPDSLINIPKIQEFAEHCTLQGLECNMVLQDERDEDVVAALIAQCGWGRVDTAGGKYSVIWEEADRAVTAVVTPDNIILGSMQILTDAENLADTFVGVFYDRDSGYAENQVERPVDVDNPTREFPLEIKLEGITSGLVAALEINRAAAANFYHWRAYKWEMTGEGFGGIGIGDVVAMANGITGEGEGFSPIAISANRLTITPFVEVEATAGFAWVWLLNNAVMSTTFTKGADGSITFADAIPQPEMFVTDVPLDYRVALFPAGEPYRHVRVTAIEPVDSDRFRYTARDEVAGYYDARTSDLTHRLIDPRGLDVEFDNGPVEGLHVAIVEFGIRRFSFLPREGDVGYLIRYGVPGALFGAMESAHEGMLTSSPYETEDLPPEGSYDIGIVAFGARNRRSEFAYLRGFDFPAETTGTGFDFKGDWDLTVTYNRGDLVRHNLQIWLSVIDGNLNIEPGTEGSEGEWVAFVVDGISARELPIYQLVPNLGGALPPAPADASWDHSEDALTGIGDWSREFPGYDPATQRVACAIATAFSDDTLSDWSTVRVCQANGDLNVVYIRAIEGTTPVRPVTGPLPVPSGWLDLSGYLAGVGLAWVTVGHRSADGVNWTWGPPLRAEALDGEPGSDGLNGLNGDNGTNGAPGADGDDGTGIEYVFVSSVTGAEVTGVANLPDPNWNYDITSHTTGTVRGNQTYYDGNPTDIGDTRPFRIRFRRSVPGSPVRNADVGTRAWVQDNAVRVQGERGQPGVAGPRTWQNLNTNIPTTHLEQNMDKEFQVANIDNYDAIVIAVHDRPQDNERDYAMGIIPRHQIPFSSSVDRRFAVGAGNQNIVYVRVFRNAAGTQLTLDSTATRLYLDKIYGVTNP